MFSVTLGGCITGSVLGWSSPANPLLEKGQYGFVISEEELAWIGSITAIGAIVGAPLVGWMVDFFGRKTTILILLFPSLIGWALIIWAESVSTSTNLILSLLYFFANKVNILSADVIF